MTVAEIRMALSKYQDTQEVYLHGTRMNSGDILEPVWGIVESWGQVEHWPYADPIVTCPESTLGAAMYVTIMS